MTRSEISLRLRALAVFRALLTDPVMEALNGFLQKQVSGADKGEIIDAYAAFVSRLYDLSPDGLGPHLMRLVCDDENAYIRCIGRGDTPPDAMKEAMDAELNLCETLSSLTPEQLTAGLNLPALPRFSVSPVKLTAHYAERVARIRQQGYGIYAKYHMFMLDDAGQIVPVRHPDPIRLTDLLEYQRERQQVLDNTRALLAGKPAANLLLTGDAGTGKSSTIKAVVNELYPEGLRILEVRRDQLYRIPALLDTLYLSPLKFILFIDDLSFARDDDNYSALKAILEGSVAAKSPNVAIYATSNRRHLMKERASDRDGDDMHVNETLQETLSLSERFGLRITFQRPDKDTYLSIVRRLASARGIIIPPEQLDLSAERFALQRGGRSPRAAKQFVDSLLAAH